MGYKYDGGFMQSIVDAVERALGRLLGAGRGAVAAEADGGLKSNPTQEYDYSSEFDQSRHAASIEESRERSVGCWDRPDESDD